VPGFVGFTVANEIYDFLYRGVAIGIGTDLYLRLLVEPSNRAGSGTETTYGGYARYTVTRDGSVFAATANGRTSNSALIELASPSTVGNGNLVWFDIVDTPSGAITRIYNAGPILPAKVVQVGKPPRFPIGKLVCTL
jgi:hypothetical protein